ncbi:hypothetical protein M9980_04955 [Sphingomonas donggukensis]|uniref:Uncharacterized protein n=1 Tax=Sphingomonas donggukensis TaxID=2949093 RepID=A0ABY4TVY1_9SPHN|nr:hypothetical protein [Sphingomonas donggukensis]URW76565.1 hypothetical protein M9980_04955 [Sphingomonas donggukensis]
MNKTVVTILTIIGAIVVLGWILKLSFKLLGVLIGAAIVIAVLAGGQKLLGGRK